MSKSHHIRQGTSLDPKRYTRKVWGRRDERLWRYEQHKETDTSAVIWRCINKIDSTWLTDRKSYRESFPLQFDGCWTKCSCELWCTVERRLWCKFFREHIRVGMHCDQTSGQKSGFTTEWRKKKGGKRDQPTRRNNLSHVFISICQS